MLNKSRLKEIDSISLYEDQNKAAFKFIDQRGLISEKIFGSTKSFKCSAKCLKLSSRTQEGQICPSCGVKSTNSITRYKYFGKIVLPFFVINSLKIKNFYSLTKRKYNYILDPKRNDLSSTMKLFLKYDKSNPADFLELTNEFNKDNCIPLNITGIYSLYISLKVAYEYLQIGKAVDYLLCFYDEILVTPPNTRLSIIGNNNGIRKLITHELDDIYLKILYFKQALGDRPKDQIKEFSDMIKLTIVNQMEDYIDDPEIQNYDEALAVLQFRCNSIYDLIKLKLSGKTGLIRKDFLGKPIDFSARAIIIPDPKLSAYQIIISEKIFIKLYLIEYSRWLWRIKELPFEKIRFFVKASDISSGYLQYIDEFVDYFFKNTSQKERLIFTNRQPTLWRYGCNVVEIVGTTKEDVIKIGPLCIESYNADFDGDTFASYRIHSTLSLEEMFDNAFLLNNIKYDHSNQFLNTLKNESKYCFSILIESKPTNSFDNIRLSNLNELIIDYNKKITDAILINKEVISYGHALVNKLAGFQDIRIREKDGIEDVSEKIFLDSANNEEYHNRLNKLNTSLNWFLTLYKDETLTLPFVEAINEIDNTNKLIHSLPQNPHIGHIIFNSLIDKKFNNLSKDNKLWKLQKGKFNKSQFARSIIGIGYVSDNRNIIANTPITGTLLQGLNEDDFFNSCFGSRKGIVDKVDIVPKSGYLERSLVLNLSPLEIVEDDCGVQYGFNIIVKNKKHAKSLVNRWIFTEKGQHLFTDDMIDEYIGKTINVRSSISCKTPHMKICKKCFGEYSNIKTPYVGILAGQYISERLTQLAMRSFHTSGACTLKIDDSIKNFIQKNLLEIDNNSYTNQFVLKFKNKTIEDFENIIGFNKKIDDYTLLFDNVLDVPNEDISKTIIEVNDLMKTELKDKINSPIDTYDKLISNILDVGFIYSTFVELVLANSYVDEDEQILRYAYPNNTNITKKYNIKKLHSLVESGILSFLYEPNANSLTNNYEVFSKIDSLDKDKLTIFEKIWLDYL
jgi:hypothetical protein